MNRRRLALTILATTLLLSFGMSLVPNGGRPSDNLLIEIAPPVVLAGVFSVIAGYGASLGTVGVRSGAIAGGLNALANLGLLLLILTIADRHFRSIGGPGLAVELPLAVPAGAVLGSVGSFLQRITRRSRGIAPSSL